MAPGGQSFETVDVALANKLQHCARPNMRLIYAVLLLFALFFTLTTGLYEDQAGRVDWYRQQVGRVRRALFHSAGQQRLALVATEPGVVAGIDLRTGGVAWRSVLGPAESIALLQPHGKSLLSVSVGPTGAFVRMWSMLGGLTWDAHVARVATAAEAVPPDAIVAGGMVLVCWQSAVAAFHLGTGELLWEWSADGAQLVTLLTPGSAAPTSTAAATAGAAAPLPPIHVFGISKSGDLFVTVLEPKDNGRDRTVGSTETLRASGASPSPGMIASLDRNTLACVDKTGTKVLLHAVGSSRVAAYPIPSLPKDTTASIQPAMELPSMLALSTSDGGSLLLKLSGAATAPTLEKAMDGSESHVFAQSSSKEGRSVLALASLDRSASSDAALSLELLNIDTDGSHGEWSAKEAMPYDEADLGPLEGLWLNAYARKDGSFGHRLLLSSADHSVQLLQAGVEGPPASKKASWIRPEALATVSSSEMLPLPALATDKDDDDGESTPSFAFALPALLQAASRKYSEAMGGQSATAEAAGPPPAHADSYGFRQAVVATTAAGKVFGLHSSDGSVLWSKRLPLAGEADAPALPYLFLCRGVHSHAVIVLQGEEQWGVRELNPFTGKLLTSAGGEVGGSGTIVHAVRLDLLAPADGSTRPPVMLVDDKLAIHVYPPTAENLAAIKAKAADLFFYLHKPSEGTLVGYAVAAGAGGALTASPRWSMALPKAGALASGRSPVSLASYPHWAAIHSPVRVLGDRNVLHKYINRNLLALGIEHAESDFDEASLQVMLVDTVSGRVVHSVSHPGMVGPLTLLMGENWLVCHFWNPKALTYQMAVSELFRNTTVADDPIGLVLSGGPDYSLRENGFDAFVHPPPHTLSQGYAFGAPVEAMAVTQTVAGLTPKFILAATVAGQMVLLDKRLLDPRRPIVPGGPQKMSQADREEGLVPYMPSLGGISPLSIMSHRHFIARPRRIDVAPTYLESTSLALLSGLDLFMTRCAPAREFDRLNEDFNYVALVFAIIFLIVATWGSGWYSNRKDLARAWK